MRALREVMLKPFVYPALLSPLYLHAYLARVNCARTDTSTNVCRDALPHYHAHTDPSQILRQVARTTKPFQQLSPLGSCLYDNSCHSTPMISDFLVFSGGSKQRDLNSH